MDKKKVLVSDAKCKCGYVLEAGRTTVEFD